MAESGGLDPEQTARLRSGYQNFSETGGFDPNTASSLRSFYGGMLNTGGYGAQDIANIRGRSNASIPAVYNRLKENLSNRLRLSGGNSPGYGAVLTKLGRQAAQDTATTARDTEADIADRLRAGKLAGAAGQFGLEGAISKGKLAGLSGGQGLEESLRSGKVYGLQGLGGLAAGDVGLMNQFDQNRLKAEGQTDTAIGNTYSPDLNLATRPGWGSNLLKGLGVAASFASPFMGAFGNMFGGGGGGVPGGSVPISSTGTLAYPGLGPNESSIWAKPTY